MFRGRFQRPNGSHEHHTPTEIIFNAVCSQQKNFRNTFCRHCLPFPLPGLTPYWPPRFALLVLAANGSNQSSHLVTETLATRCIVRRCYSTVAPQTARLTFGTTTGWVDETLGVPKILGFFAVPTKNLLQGGVPSRLTKGTSDCCALQIINCFM